MTYRKLLKEAIGQLEENNVYSSGAQLLLLSYCQEEGIDLYAEYENEATEDIISRFNAGVARLMRNEPLGYILGYEPFLGHNIMVDKRVFIPRPETEELVAQTLMLIDEKYSATETIIGLDIGTGSGAIPVTLMLEEPKIKMWAVDISEEALEVAEANAEKFAVKVNFVHSDLFAELDKDIRFNFIIANPPYIREDEKLDKSVKDYEPSLALFGGKTGLDFYKRIMTEATTWLKPEGFLAFEIGYDQAEALKQMAINYYPESDIEIKKDLNGKNRMLFIINKQNNDITL